MAAWALPGASRRDFNWITADSPQSLKKARAFIFAGGQLRKLRPSQPFLLEVTQVEHWLTSRLPLAR